MSCSTHSLSSLPAVVLDNVLCYLEQGDLYNISLVCKTLYGPSERYLYRNLDDYEEHSSLIAHNLTRNPSLAFYVRTFTSYDPVLLEYLCTLAPLNLRRLTLEWNPEDSMYDYRHFVNAIDPQSCVEHIVFTLHTYLEKDLMEHLYCFSRLTCVELVTPPSGWSSTIFSIQYSTIQEIFDSLNCPTLESVFLENVGCSWEDLQELNIGNKLPSFRGLCLRDIEVDFELASPCEIMWDTLSRFLSRSIFFKIEWSESYSSFYTLVLSYASENGLDPTPLIQWLAKSDHFFGVQIYHDRFGLALEELSEIELVQTLEIMRQVGFERKAMSFSLFDLPQPLSFSAISLFYENIFELYINLVDGIHLDPHIIEQCIVTLPKLEIFDIGLLYSKDFTPASKCTTATYYFRPNRKMRKHPPSMELAIVRGKRPSWKIFECDCNARKHYVRLCRPGTARGVMDLEEEVSGWFQWSKSLRRVRLWFEFSDESNEGQD